MKTKKSTIANVQSSTVENNNVETKQIINADILKNINALNISNQISVSASKQSIFKKEFQTKNERTKCRNKLIREKSIMLDDKKIITYVGLIPTYLSNLSENKLEDSEKNLSEIKEICNKYYVAESNFQNVNDYVSSGRDAEILKIFSTFIEVQKSLK